MSPSDTPLVRPVSLAELKAFFSTPERPLEISELLELKKADPQGMQQLKQGIANESLTY